ncbi:MAG: tetratricopeptide repeat protein [Ardenticatenaceae bacterium]
MIKRVIIFVLAGLTMALLLFAYADQSWAQGSPETESMGLANQLYERGNFIEAAQTYKQLVDIGIQNSALYYNLGNAYFKQGDFGRAILNYERGARLAPRDSDIQANLALARSQRTDQYVGEEASTLSQIALFARAWLTLNEMALITLALWLLFTLLLLVYWNVRLRRLREGLQYLLFITTLLLLVGLFSLANRLYVERMRPQAIIVVEEVPLLSGPGEQYIVQLTLHSGAEVALIETQSNWARLSLPGDQLQGWVPMDAVERVLISK